MSKNSKKASDAEQGEPKKDSIYDFLYCDTRRIASFLSQFDDFGHLEKLVKRESITRGSRRGWKVGLGGGGLLAGTGGSGNASFEVGPDSSGSEASERIYDPLWANALTLLDYLQEADLLVRTAETARIGHFVIVTGALSILDLSLFKGMWQLPALREAIASGAMTDQEQTKLPAANRRDRRTSKNKTNSATSSNHSESERAIDAGIAIIGMLPHAIQARISMKDPEHLFWCSLSSDFLVISSHDLLLKHGAAIAGTWNMIGILDALPEVDSNSLITDRGIQSVSESSTLSSNPFGAMMNHFLPHIRPMLGRPLDAFGITPLMIFREIAA